MILKPIEFLYHLVSQVKNSLYDYNFIETVDLNIPVISVGNLSFGGTGKTPFIVYLAEVLLVDKKKVAIICRSYKSSLRYPEKVDLSMPNKEKIYGDEACLLQTLLPTCEVWSGPQKYLTAQACVSLSQQKPDLILIDDGFSHRKLKRKFDLILVDSTKGFKDYLRESKSNLLRAQAVLLTKTNFVSEEKILSLKTEIIKLAPILKDSIYTAESEMFLNTDKENSLFVFCGLGNPDSFKIGLEKLGYKINTFCEFTDHFSYDAKAQEKLVNDFKLQQQTEPNLKMVTTEKDFIKLSVPELKLQVCTVKNKIKLVGANKEGLLEKIRSLI